MGRWCSHSEQHELHHAHSPGSELFPFRARSRKRQLYEQPRLGLYPLDSIAQPAYRGSEDVSSQTFTMARPRVVQERYVGILVKKADVSLLSLRPTPWVSDSDFVHDMALRSTTAQQLYSGS